MRSSATAAVDPVPVATIQCACTAYGRAADMARVSQPLPGTIICVSQLDPATRDPLQVLEDEDRAWLEERLQEYRELLAYLHDH